MGTHKHHTTYTTAFRIGILLNITMVCAEALFGFLSGSIALIADAGHNASDVLGLLLAWGANHLEGSRPTHRKTYGFRSTTILAALLNAVVLYAATGGIAVEAVRRLIHPSPVSGRIMILVAAIGVVINSITALLFAAGRKRDLNIKGVFLHMAADAAVSAGVVICGAGILLTGWMWLDPVISLLISAVILIGTWGMLQESVNLALHGVPSGIDTHQVLDYLEKLPGVDAVHDLHIWAMSTTENALTVHIVKPEPQNDDDFIAGVRQSLKDRFDIAHVTIQIERKAFSVECGDACELKGTG